MRIVINTVYLHNGSKSCLDATSLLIEMINHQSFSNPENEYYFIINKSNPLINLKNNSNVHQIIIDNKTNNFASLMLWYSTKLPRLLKIL